VTSSTGSGTIDAAAPALSTAEVADIAEKWAGSAAELERLGDDPLRRTGLRLLATDDYDVWLLRWPHRTRVSPHDHGGSVAAFAVISGELAELRRGDSGPTSRTVGPGEVVTIEHGNVPDVAALCGPSYSVHVYSPPLTETSFYDEFGVVVMRQMAVEGIGAADHQELAWSE